MARPPFTWEASASSNRSPRALNPWALAANCARRSLSLWAIKATSSVLSGSTPYPRTWISSPQ